jgi:hypothetical protein
VKRPLSKPRASSRSLTSTTTTTTSSAFAASLFPRRPALTPIRGLSGRAGPTRRTLHTRSEQAGVLRTLPEVPDVQRTQRSVRDHASRPVPRTALPMPSGEPDEDVKRVAIDLGGQRIEYRMGATASVPADGPAAELTGLGVYRVAAASARRQGEGRQGRWLCR